MKEKAEIELELLARYLKMPGAQVIACEKGIVFRLDGKSEAALLWTGQVRKEK